MRLRQILDLLSRMAFWAAMAGCTLPTLAGAAPSLSRLDIMSYSQWLQSDAAAATRTDLYPGGQELESLKGPHQVDRRILAARAMSYRSESLERAWDRSEFESEDQSLATARALRELGEYADALGWYRTARHNRSVTAADPTLDAEIFACAVLTADSLAVFEELLSLVGRSELDERDDQLELAFRHYAGRRDATNLEFLRSKVAGRLDTAPPRIRFWYAYTLANVRQHADALPVVLALVHHAEIVSELEPWQRRWVVRALPDLLYLSDRPADAYRLYELLAAVDTGAEGLWARYQLANRFLLSGEYDLAASIYDESCAESEPAPWQQRACALAETARRLAVIRKEGERHGTDGIHSH